MLRSDGNDTLEGDATNDTLYGDAGDTTVMGGSGSGAFDGGARTDKATDYDYSRGVCVSNTTYEDSVFHSFFRFRVVTAVYLCCLEYSLLRGKHTAPGLIDEGLCGCVPCCGLPISAYWASVMMRTLSLPFHSEKVTLTWF